MTIKHNALLLVGGTLVIVGVIALAIFMVVERSCYKYQPVPVWLKIMFVLSFAILLIGIFACIGAGMGNTKGKYVNWDKMIKA